MPRKADRDQQLPVNTRSFLKHAVVPLLSGLNTSATGTVTDGLGDRYLSIPSGGHDVLTSQAVSAK